MRLICGWIEPQLTPFDAGALPSWRAGLVARHLASCESCRAQWESTANLAVLLRECAPAPAVPGDDLWARLEGQLTPQPSVATPRRPAFAAAWPVAATACALVAGVVVYRSATGGAAPSPAVQRVALANESRRESAPVAAPTLPPKVVARVSVPPVARVEDTADAPDPFTDRTGNRAAPAPLALPRTASGSNLRDLMRGSRYGASGSLAVRPSEMRAVASQPPRLSMPGPEIEDPGPPSGLAGGLGSDRGEPDVLGGVRVSDVADAAPPRYVRRGAAIPDDLTGRASLANRPPSEAVNVGDMQRSLFR